MLQCFLLATWLCIKFIPAASHQHTSIIEIIAGSGHMEDACDTARAILNANANSAAFVLYPLAHTSCDKGTCINNLRLIQDRMLLILGPSLFFNFCVVSMG